MTETPEDRTPNRRVDATALQGLAHPLRVQILDELSVHGPATASKLAERLGESSGATSYHLRQLERYGFVEDDPERGTGRERWWRRPVGRLTISQPELVDEGPAAEAAGALVVGEMHRAKQRRLDEFRRNFRAWPRAWQDASFEAVQHLRLTPGELRELVADLDAALARWQELSRSREPGEVVDVELHLNAFPNSLPTADNPSGIPSDIPSTDD